MVEDQGSWCLSGLVGARGNVSEVTRQGNVVTEPEYCRVRGNQGSVQFNSTSFLPVTGYIFIIKFREFEINQK